MSTEIKEEKSIDEEYIDWINWTRSDEKYNIPPLTNTQVRFAKFLLTHKEEIIKIGDLELVFKSVRKHLKS